MFEQKQYQDKKPNSNKFKNTTNSQEPEEFRDSDSNSSGLQLKENPDFNKPEVQLKKNPSPVKFGGNIQLKKNPTPIQQVQLKSNVQTDGELKGDTDSILDEVTVQNDPNIINADSNPPGSIELDKSKDSPPYGSDIQIETPLTPEQKERYRWDEIHDMFKLLHSEVESKYLEPWIRKQLKNGWQIGNSIPLLNVFRAEYGESKVYESTGKQVPTLYVYYYGKEGKAYGNFPEVRNELIRKRDYDGFWVYVNSITGKQSILHQRNSLTKYYMRKNITNVDISNVYLYITAYDIPCEYTLQEIIEAGLDSSIFRKVVEKVQRHLFGQNVDDYGLYTDKTKSALEESIKEQIEEREQERLNQVIDNDYYQLANLSAKGQATLDLWKNPNSLAVYKAYKAYRIHMISGRPSPGASVAFDRYEKLAIKHFGSTKNFVDKKNAMIILFQRRANQIARTVLKNTRKFINNELDSYENSWKIKDLTKKLIAAKADYGEYLYHRYEGDRWADLSEQMDSYPLKGTLNEYDGYAINSMGRTRSQAARVANMGHPMMKYYTQSGTTDELGYLLGMSYTHPNMPEFKGFITKPIKKPQNDVKKPAPKPNYHDFNQSTQTANSADTNEYGLPKPYIPFLDKDWVPSATTQKSKSNPYSDYAPTFSFNSDLSQENKKPDAPATLTVKSALESVGSKINANISKTLHNLKEDPHKVWELDNVVKMTIFELGLDKNPGAMAIVQDKVDSVQTLKMIKDIFMSVVNVALGILAVSGIGTPFAVLAGLGAASVGAYQYFENKADYDFQYAAANTGLTPEESLSSVEPSDMWLYLDLIGIGMDVFAVLNVIAKVGKTARLIKLGSSGDDVNPRFMMELNEAIRGEVKSVSKADAFVNKMAAKLEDPEYLKAIRSEGTAAKLNKLDEVKESIAKVEAKKVRIAEQRKLVNEQLDKLFKTEPGVLKVDLLPFLRTSTGLLAEAFFAARKGITTVEGFLLELKAKGLAKNIDNVTTEQREALENALKEGNDLNKTNPEIYVDLKKAADAEDLGKIDEILNARANKGSLNGKKTVITDKMDESTRRSLMRENESAQTLADNGYNVFQNPKTPGNTNPDYLVNGEVFDNYAPSTLRIRNIASEMEVKINRDQTKNIVLNLNDTEISTDALKRQLTDYPIDGLEKIIIVKGDQVINFYPF